MRPIDSCITQLKVPRPSRTYNESEEEEEEEEEEERTAADSYGAVQGEACADPSTFASERSLSFSSLELTDAKVYEP